MRAVPQSVLDLLASLPDGKPVRIVLDRNSNNEWKAHEIYIFHGPLPSTPVTELVLTRGRIDKSE